MQLPPVGNFQQNRRPFLIVHLPRYPGTRASPAKAPCPAGQRTGLGIEGDLLVLLALQIRDLGGAFLDYWCWRAMRSRLEPMKGWPTCCAPMSRSY